MLARIGKIVVVSKRNTAFFEQTVKCCCGLFLTQIDLRNGVARLQIFAHFPPRIGCCFIYQ